MSISMQSYITKRRKINELLLELDNLVDDSYYNPESSLDGYLGGIHSLLLSSIDDQESSESISELSKGYPRTVL